MNSLKEVYETAPSQNHQEVQAVPSQKHLEVSPGTTASQLTTLLEHYSSEEDFTFSVLINQPSSVDLLPCLNSHQNRLLSLQLDLPSSLGPNTLVSLSDCLRTAPLLTTLKLGLQDNNLHDQSLSPLLSIRPPSLHTLALELSNNQLKCPDLGSLFSCVPLRQLDLFSYQNPLSPDCLSHTLSNIPSLLHLKLGLFCRKASKEEKSQLYACLKRMPLESLSLYQIYFGLGTSDMSALSASLPSATLSSLKLILVGNALEDSHFKPLCDRLPQLTHLTTLILVCPQNSLSPESMASLASALTFPDLQNLHLDFTGNQVSLSSALAESILALPRLAEVSLSFDSLRLTLTSPSAIRLHLAPLTKEPPVKSLTSL